MRTATSSGFSVSSTSMRRATSVSFDLGAKTTKRLEGLSGQMRTCWPAEGALLLLEGGGSLLLPPPLESPEGGPPKEMPIGPPIEGDELLREGDDLREEPGPGACAFNMRLRMPVSSSGSAYFNG